ncbi:hypothetical protein PR048_033626 [Dryococelus australis]|uniref:Uncharacterized protein n=1 Tax=Dryococelus australis TaxID=614101 RepID=A0ABQ9G218_9NEOP|nr:hypothetical protein PR048_033626 [Dryococelus australis]
MHASHKGRIWSLDPLPSGEDIPLDRATRQTDWLPRFHSSTSRLRPERRNYNAERILWIEIQTKTICRTTNPSYKRGSRWCSRYYTPPTRANQVRFPAGSLPGFRTWESCRTMPLLGGFSRVSPVSPTFAFRRCSMLTSLHPSSDIKNAMLKAAQISSYSHTQDKQFVKRKIKSKAKTIQYSHILKCAFSKYKTRRENYKTAIYSLMTKNYKTVGQYHLGSPLVDDRPIMNAVKYRVVSGVVWANRMMVSSITDANRTGVLAVVDIGDSLIICLKCHSRAAIWRPHKGPELPTINWRDRTNPRAAGVPLNSRSIRTDWGNRHQSGDHAEQLTIQKRNYLAPMRVKRGQHGAAPECEVGGNGRSPKKPARQAASSGTIPTRKNPGATPKGIEHFSPWWRASGLPTEPPRPPTTQSYFNWINEPILLFSNEAYSQPLELFIDLQVPQLNDVEIRNGCAVTAIALVHSGKNTADHSQRRYCASCCSNRPVRSQLTCTHTALSYECRGSGTGDTKTHAQRLIAPKRKACIVSVVTLYCANKRSTLSMAPVTGCHLSTKFIITPMSTPSTLLTSLGAESLGTAIQPADIGVAKLRRPRRKTYNLPGRNRRARGVDG